MRLFQHDEFPNIVAAAAAARSLDEAFVEKDYYITEILRIIAGRYQPGQVIFKGGTSLSKAWGLIERLSEDVDLLVVPERFEPRLGRRRIDTELAALTEAIATRRSGRTRHRAQFSEDSRTTLRGSVRHGCYLLFDMALHSSPIKSNDVRLPDPQPGEALVVERYSAKHVKAVILHPDDFAELQGSSELLEDLVAAPELSDLEARAHWIAESPEGKLIDNETSVRRLLGL